MRVYFTTGLDGIFLDASHPALIASGLRELVVRCGTNCGVIYGGSDGNKEVGQWQSDEIKVDNLRPNAYVLRWKFNNIWYCWFVGLHGQMRVI